MARIVETSDDDLPDIATLLKAAGRRVGTKPVAAARESEEGKPIKAQQRGSDLRAALKSTSGETQDVEEKKKPRKRMLINRNDNPLLKPLSVHVSGEVSTSPSKRSVKSRQPRTEVGVSAWKSSNSITIPDSDKEDERSEVVLAQVSKEPHQKVTRETTTKPKRNLLSTALDQETPEMEFFRNTVKEASLSAPKRTARVAIKETESKVTMKSPAEPSNTSSKTVVETMHIAENFDSDSVDNPRLERESKSNSRKSKRSNSPVSSLDDLSDFVIDDSAFLDDEDSVIAMIPPRSARFLVKGRRPAMLSESDEESFTDRRKATDTSRLSSSLKLKEEDLYILESPESKALPPVLTAVKKPFKSAPKGSDQFVDKLVLDLEGLSVWNGVLPDKSPTKVPRDQKFTTPPGSPILKPIKLKSPTKRFPAIPKSPHRPSMDSFWDPEVINEWNDQYSPEKLLKTFQPENNVPKPPLFSPKKSPIKQDRIVRDAKKAFSEKKHALAESFLIELDDVLTIGQVSKISASTGGIKIIWSKKLNTTAGRANWKRETVRSTSTQGTAVGVTHRHHASIELAEKVINDEERLLNVIAHEFCHLANFMISNIKTNPHGKEFKEWAAKCSRHFGDRGIEVTTKHSYEIDYKYVWECESCGLEFKRHSKSIDPMKHQCGGCKSKLVQTKPVPRGNPTGGAKKVSEYQTFVKENMSKVREENPGSPQKDVLGLVAKRYQEFKTSKLKMVEVADPSPSDGVRKKEGMVGDADVVKTLERKLNFLDLTSP